MVTIAIIGVLAVSIIIVVNPVKKRSQARDASRKAGIAQISNALSAYFVQTDSYPATLADLVPGELKSLVKDPTGSDFNYSAQGNEGGACSTASKNCVRAVLYGIYEMPNAGCSQAVAYWGWTSTSLRSGKICSSGVPLYSDVPIDD